jgi:hypothetical protein
VHYLKRRIGLAVVAALAVTLLPAARVVARGQQGTLASGIEQAKRTASSSGIDEETAKDLAGRLACAEEAMKAGHTLRAYHLLRDPYAEAIAYAYARTKSGVAKAGPAAFEREWRRLGGDIRARERRLDAAGRTPPAAARAMMQVARGQSAPYYKSGRLYGLNASLDEGLIYGGLAAGYLDYALVCRDMPGAAKGPAHRFVLVAPLLSALETETVRAYDRADEQGRRRFIRVNSTLKLASELDLRGWYEGALYQYLEASYALGLLVDAAPDQSRIEALGADIRSAAARLDAGGADDSIGRIFLQSAESALAGACGLSDREKRAAVLVDRVLPRYFEYMGSRSTR